MIFDLRFEGLAESLTEANEENEGVGPGNRRIFQTCKVAKETKRTKRLIPVKNCRMIAPQLILFAKVLGNVSLMVCFPLMGSYGVRGDELHMSEPRWAAINRDEARLGAIRRDEP